MTDYTTFKIKKFSTDTNEGNALEALLDWYGVTALMYVPESAARKFLGMLERGEIDLSDPSITSFRG